MKWNENLNDEDTAYIERLFKVDDPTPSRKRKPDAQATPTTSEQRSARLARNAKPTLIIDTTESERRSSRISTRQNYNEDEEDSDMAGDKDPTFDKDHVDAHPDEKFYHTGNGWYKRGQRPKVRNYAKHRESEGHASVRRSDGSWQFDEGKTIHVSQLDNYPGVEFHHCGNGWYRPGPDSTGHRTSRIVGESDEEDEFDEGNDDIEDEADDQGELIAEDAIVDRAYARRHPEIEWVHRGNGRYKRKSVIEATSAPPEPEQEERDQTIYSKQYVFAHPDEEFHHRGNARYMRGPPPDHWASVRRRKSQNANLAQAAQEDDSVLFSKAYVDSHPNEVFHHRGQGRYARGPRPKTAATPDDAEDSDVDPDGLVDTDYVESHPHETFHHRGQGRWARGLPPAGASNKVAVRGPAAKEKTDEATPLEDEDEANKPPAITALVLKTEGPDRFPGLNWHYRGGGKWGRITKQEFEEMQRAVSTRKPTGKGKMKAVDGPEAQLEREAAAAEAALRDGFDDDFQMPAEVDMNGMPTKGKGRVKRRRTANRGALQTVEGDTPRKQTSKTQSQAPTPKLPKPRMLEPEEDVLTEEDMPSLYRESWSPDSDNLDDEADRLLRATYQPMNPPEKFVKGLTKHDPQVRSLDNLLKLAANGAEALKQIQKEYLDLEKITAPHARIPRKQAKGGRVPVDPQVFEDKKEADLYDYSYDARKLGHQNPAAQKIQRDAEGRELRGRRGRSGPVVQPNGILPGWNFGEEEQLGPRRAVKPVNRFDGVVDSPRKRAPRGSAAGTSKAASITPDPSAAATPLGGSLKALPKGSQAAINIPKRIRELRGENTGAGSLTREGSPARKGRPPGSKNLHKRRDAGIKKGPRKPKVLDSIETEEEV